MLSGEPPFVSSDPKKILNDVIKRKINFPDTFSEDAIDLIKKLLNPNPKLRLGSGKWGSAEIKAHSFFDKTNWEEIESRSAIPPFIPLIKSDSDTNHFDKLYTAGNNDRMTSQSRLNSWDLGESNFYFNAFQGNYLL